MLPEYTALGLKRIYSQCEIFSVILVTNTHSMLGQSFSATIKILNYILEILYETFYLHTLFDFNFLVFTGLKLMFNQTLFTFVRLFALSQTETFSLEPRGE